MPLNIDPIPVTRTGQLPAMLDAQACLQLMDHAGGPLSDDGPSEFWADAGATVIIGFVGQYLIGLGALWWLGA